MSNRAFSELPLIWRITKIIGDVMWDMRAPLIVSIIAFFVFFIPNQVEEVYKVLALEWEFGFEGLELRPVFSILLLAALSYFLWSVSRAMWANSEDLHPEVTFSPLARTISHVFSMIIALLPIVGVLLALVPADLLEGDELLKLGSALLGAEEHENHVLGLKFVSLLSANAALGDTLPVWFGSTISEYATIADNLINFIRALIVMFVVVFAFLLWRAFREGSYFSRRPFAPRYLLFFLVSLALVVALIAAQPIIDSLGGQRFYLTWLITGFGGFAVICLFFIFIAYFFAAFTRLYDIIGLPVLTILFSAALIFALAGLNKNHKVRLYESKVEAPERLGQAFAEWMRSRPPERVERYAARGQPYPVYIVTARGGGVYAANLTALTLARLYTACPALRHHVFAFSGVSGGSLGASTFSAFWLQAMKEQRPEVVGEGCSAQPRTGTTELEREIQTYLRHDFLTPVLAGALFPDFLQRFIAPGFGVLDRARAFDASLSHAWVDTMSITGKDVDPRENPFTTNFLEFSGDLKQVGGPSLILNTTNVESGRRFAVAPFDQTADTNIPLNFVYPISVPDETGVKDYDISLATAISLSARFPYILPPGQYPQRYGRYVDQRDLADGGYFESSAIDTGLDIARAIKSWLDEQESLEGLGGLAALSGVIQQEAVDIPIDPAFRFIVLNEAYTSEATKLEAEQEVSEFIAPVAALDNTRYRRGELAQWRLTRETQNGQLVERAYLVELQHGEFDMPLGWHLSPATQKVISEQIGMPSQCETKLTRGADTSVDFTVELGVGASSVKTLAQEFNRNRCAMLEIVSELEPN